jgi:tetratricopeptide (TPR) repeat protein
MGSNHIMLNSAKTPSPLRRHLALAAVTLAAVCAAQGAGAIMDEAQQGKQTMPQAALETARLLAGFTMLKGEVRAGEELIAADPTDPRGYMQAALEAYRGGDEARARDHLERGRERALPSAELLVALAALHVSQEKLHEAEDAALAALEIQPRFALAYVQLAAVYGKAGLYETAIAHCEQAIDCDGRCVPAWLHLGAAHSAAANHRQAVEAYRSALTLAPSDPTAQCNLVHNLIALGKPGEAEACCQKWLNAGADYADLHVALGEALEAQQKWQPAFAAYGRAVELRPDCGPAHSRRGRLFCRFQQYEAAVQECRTALEVDPDDAVAHAFLGVAYAHLGNKEEAEIHALRAEVLGMQMNPVWKLIGW